MSSHLKCNLQISPFAASYGMSDETESQETWTHICCNPKFRHFTHWAHPHIHCLSNWGYFILFTFQITHRHLCEHKSHLAEADVET